MRRTPWWVLLSATGAPVLLIGGWTVAAALQPAGYDATRDTISALAGLAATDRWVMTVGLAGLGICHTVTALGLRPAARAGRLILATGGIATLLVSLLPLPRTGTSTPHGLAALVAFLALAIWPAFATPPTATTPGTAATPPADAAPWALRRRVAVTAAAALLALIGWFGLTLTTHHLVGASERLAAGAQALWPLLVAVSCVRHAKLASRS